MVCEYMYFSNPDSHEFLGDDENSSSQPDKAAASTNTASIKSQDLVSDQDESMETETTAAAGGEREADKENGEAEHEEEMETTTLTDAGGASSGSGGKEGEEGEEKEGEEGEKAKPQGKEEQEYNPLIVRRSNRAIKPTKDVDLYLLGAQFGIDVEGSDADSSDQEFAPAVESDREFQYFILMPMPLIV